MFFSFLDYEYVDEYTVYILYQEPVRICGGKLVSSQLIDWYFSCDIEIQ